MVGEGDVVIGGEQGDQAEDEASERLNEAKAVEAWPGDGCGGQVWRSRRLFAARWRPGGSGGWVQGCGATTGSGDSSPSVPPLALVRHSPLSSRGGLKAQKKGELSGEGKGAWTTTPAHRSVGWPEAPPQRHQRVAHSQRPGLKRCGIRSDAPARSPGSDRAWCPAALMAEGTALEPVVEAVIAAIKVGGAMVSGEGVGEAMVLLRCALGLGGASSRRRNPSNGPARGICSTKSVRVRPEALTARSIKP